MGRFGAFPMDGAAPASEPLLRESDEAMVHEVGEARIGRRGPDHLYTPSVDLLFCALNSF